jgi:hypothetical protein
MARLRPPGHFYIAVIIISVAAVVVSADDGGKTEGDVLVAFRDTLRAADGSPPGPLRSWGTPGPCNGNHSSWYGVSCHGNGSVQGLQLERLGLAGGAPEMGSLSVLPGLRVISLSDNALTGPFPNVSQLGVLKMLYLSRNKFSGVIPVDAFMHMRGLRKLYLTSNDFSGPVPSSITSPRLLELSLAHNKFDGPLPDFSQPELRFVDVSENNLSGPIPAGLSRFNASMFQGTNRQIQIYPLLYYLLTESKVCMNRERVLDRELIREKCAFLRRQQTPVRQAAGRGLRPRVVAR